MSDTSRGIHDGTCCLTSARALTSVRSRQLAVHPPWRSVDSSRRRYHDDGSTARAARAAKTVSPWDSAACVRRGHRLPSVLSLSTPRELSHEIVSQPPEKLITTPVNAKRTITRRNVSLVQRLYHRYEGKNEASSGRK